jgi:valyl-tRNA synthetase
MAKRSVDAVKEGRLTIRPAFHEKTWYQWLDNIRPWCVSRQLWWGHRIPAYFCFTKTEVAAGSCPDKNSDKHKSRWIVARSAQAATEAAAKLLGCAEAEVVLEQDEDVLDTWFSSGLFPFR